MRMFTCAAWWPRIPWNYRYQLRIWFRTAASQKLNGMRGRNLERLLAVIEREIDIPVDAQDPASFLVPWERKSDSFARDVRL